MAEKILNENELENVDAGAIYGAGPQIMTATDDNQDDSSNDPKMVGFYKVPI